MVSIEQLDALREGAREQLRLSLEAAHLQYQEAVRAIEAIARLVKPQPTSSADPKSNKAQLIKAVRQVVNSIDESFDLREVVNRVRAENPQLAATLQNTSVSTTLRRLQEARLIEVVSVGKGTRPTTYRRSANVAAL